MEAKCVFERGERKDGDTLIPQNHFFAVKSAQDCAKASPMHTQTHMHTCTHTDTDVHKHTHTHTHTHFPITVDCP